jgi:hypothetical protein
VRSTSRRIILAAVSGLATPIIFVGILLIWRAIDQKVNQWLGSREVSQYIRDHQSIVTRRLEHPNVHSFSLTHHPSETGALFIQFDVDDIATYELLKSELNDVWSLRNDPSWQTTVRSNERLPRNYGGLSTAMRGIDKLMKAALIALIASLAPVTYFNFQLLRHTRRVVPARAIIT